MKLDKKTFAKNVSETGTRTFGLADLNRMRARYELEKTEPLYRELVSAREAYQAVGDEWFAVSMTVQSMRRAGLTRNSTHRQFCKSCKMLFELREKLGKRLQKAEKNWAKREKKIANVMGG